MLSEDARCTESDDAFVSIPILLNDVVAMATFAVKHLAKCDVCFYNTDFHQHVTYHAVKLCSSPKNKLDQLHLGLDLCLINQPLCCFPFSSLILLLQFGFIL